MTLSTFPRIAPPLRHHRERKSQSIPNLDERRTKRRFRQTICATASWRWAFPPPRRRRIEDTAADPRRRELDRDRAPRLDRGIIDCLAMNATAPPTAARGRVVCWRPSSARRLCFRDGSSTRCIDCKANAVSVNWSVFPTSTCCVLPKCWSNPTKTRHSTRAWPYQRRCTVCLVTMFLIRKHAVVGLYAPFAN